MKERFRNKNDALTRKANEERCWAFEKYISLYGQDLSEKGEKSDGVCIPGVALKVKVKVRLEN